MRRDYIKWYSPSLHRDMELLAFGERGFPFVVFPTSGGRFYEYEDHAYFHAPLDYLPDVNGWQLDQLRRNRYILAVGNHDPLFDQNVKMAHVLGTKSIPHTLDVWQGFGHDWPWWFRMAEKFL